MIQGPLSDAPRGWVGNINQPGGVEGHIKAMTFSVPTNCCQVGMWAQHFQIFYCFKGRSQIIMLNVLLNKNKQTNKRNTVIVKQNLSVDLAAVQGLPVYNCCLSLTPSLCWKLAHHLTRLLQSYIYIELIKVPICIAVLSGPVPWELGRMCPQSVSPVSAQTCAPSTSPVNVSHASTPPAPTHPPAVYLLRLRGSCQSLLGTQHPLWGKLSCWLKAGRNLCPGRKVGVGVRGLNRGRPSRQSWHQLCRCW